MINVSFLDKIKQFIEIIGSNNKFLIVTSSILVLLLIILFVCKKNNKIIKIVCTISYLAMIAILIYIYHKQILTLIDYLVENIVANLLFPNLAIYMGVLLVINIIVIVSIFSDKIKFYVKSINIVCFAITQLFLYFIIENVIRNNVNVYEKLSIYTNQDLLVLIELSMQLFVVWICVLGIIRLIDYLMDRSEKVSLNNEIIVNNDLLIENNIDDNDEVNVVEESNIINEFIEYVPIKKVKKSYE